jgi:hypothetical protein
MQVVHGGIHRGILNVVKDYGVGFESIRPGRRGDAQAPLEFKRGRLSASAGVCRGDLSAIGSCRGGDG